MRTEKAEVIWSWYDNGQLVGETYRVNGELHNPTGPACRNWHSNGQLRSEEYIVHGRYHNATVPACRSWYANGQLNKAAYWINGKRHNTTGPAYFHWNDPAYFHWNDNGHLLTEEYWVNGKQLTKEQFANRNKETCNGKVVEIDGKKYQLKEIVR